MVSGVALLRLIGALVEVRCHEVRVYTAEYPLPKETPRPEVHRSPCVPLFLYPDVRWAFPRQRDIVADLAAFCPTASTPPRSSRSAAPDSRASGTVR